MEEMNKAKGIILQVILAIVVHLALLDIVLFSTSVNLRLRLRKISVSDLFIIEEFND